MAKVKAALRALDEVLDGLPDHLERLRAKTGREVRDIEIEFSGSLNLNRDGGIGADVEASADALALATGAPVTVKAGAGSKWDNQGTVKWRVRVLA